jgi:hypothetical protein
MDIKRNNSIVVTPPAGSVVQSLRSIGYDLKSAIADIIDNSIAASAQSVEILLDLDSQNKPFLFILDNGQGMDRTGLISAMTPGSSSPLAERKHQDLGRFGMGLKTASFSQCVDLTVVSKTQNGFVGARWDLNHVSNSNEWELELIDENMCLKILDSQNVDIPKTGTLVLWHNCDRISEGITDLDVLEGVLGSHVKQLIDHLSLVFHKFIERKKKPLELIVNKNKLFPKDPFARFGHNETPMSSITLTDSLRINELECVEIKGYLLPHPTKLSTKQHANLCPKGDYFNSQGFYIYRAGRLLTHGSWFRLAKKNQANKLVRVEVNIPNSVDSKWKLDIKKSKVELPSEVRAFLKSKIDNLATKSQRIFNGRSNYKRTNSESIWERSINKDTRRIEYIINKEHNLINGLLSRVTSSERSTVETIIKLIQMSVPVHYISNDLASSYNLNKTLDESTKQDISTALNNMLGLGLDEESILASFENDDSSDAMVNEFVCEYLRKK